MYKAVFYSCLWSPLRDQVPLCKRTKRCSWPGLLTPISLSTSWSTISKNSCNTEEVHRCIVSEPQNNLADEYFLTTLLAPLIECLITLWLINFSKDGEIKIHSLYVDCIDWFFSSFFFLFFFDYSKWGNMKRNVNGSHSLKAKTRPRSGGPCSCSQGNPRCCRQG